MLKEIDSVGLFMLKYCYTVNYGGLIALSSKMEVGKREGKL